MTSTTRGLAALLTTCVLLLGGCISDHNFGCQTPTVVAAGSPEGDVFAQHGCPDQIIEIGNKIGPGIKHWNKYLVVYRIAEGHAILGTLLQDDAFTNIAYLIENGKVINGGRVGEGSGSAILMALKSARHPKNRVGYGGDPEFPGSYGQSGRRGGATVVGNQARDGYGH